MRNELNKNLDVVPKSKSKNILRVKLFHTSVVQSHNKIYQVG